MSKLYPQVAEAAVGTEVRDIVVTNVKEHLPLPLRLLFTLAREKKEGAAATAQEIVDHCRADLAPFKVPVDIAFRDELPKTIVGKVLRRQLAEEEPEVALTPLARAG